MVILHELGGDPAFAGDGYHLTAASVAIDAGVETDEGSDIDAQVRPMGWGHDLGCDEYPGARMLVAKSTPGIVVDAGATVTYTITITSDGELEATGAVLTDTLDGWQRGLTVASSQGPCTLLDPGWGGHAVCTPGTLASGTRVVVTLTAEVSPAADIRQQLVNQVQARSNETSGNARAETFLQDCHVRIDDEATEYTSVQAAVDAATSGQLIKVAGTCLGAGNRSGLLQQVYLDKDLTIQGGYTTSNWTVPDPAANPTSLDALGLGRVVYVSPGVSTTIAGLEIKSGDTDPVFESHGVENLDEIGGGVFALTATVRIRDCHLRDNWASVGGALWMQGCSVELSDSTLDENRAFYAGGFGLDNCRSLLTRNTVHANSASDYSGGGGAIFGGQATLDRNLLTENQAEARSSGGLLLWQSEITMTNNVVSDNRAVSSGAGVRLIDTNADLRHNTFARNESGDGTGIHISGSSSRVAMTNTILVDHGVGISVTGASELSMDGVLWHNSPVTVSQESGAQVTIQNQHWGDPVFQADGYHLSAYSAAVDMGSDAGVAVDIEGDQGPRVPATTWARTRMGWSPTSP